MEEEVIALVFATLLGGGSAGRYWFKERSRWHQEQLSESRRILIDNDSQHRKLNNIVDNLDKILARLDYLETKVSRRSKNSKRNRKGSVE